MYSRLIGLWEGARKLLGCVTSSSSRQIFTSNVLQIYSETRKNVLSGNDIPHEVLILRDGFSQFQVKHKVSYQVVHPPA